MLLMALGVWLLEWGLTVVAWVLMRCVAAAM